MYIYSIYIFKSYSMKVFFLLEMGRGTVTAAMQLQSGCLTSGVQWFTEKQCMIESLWVCRFLFNKAPDPVKELNNDEPCLLYSFRMSSSISIIRGN